MALYLTKRSTYCFNSVGFKVRISRRFSIVGQLLGIPFNNTNGASVGVAAAVVFAALGVADVGVAVGITAAGVDVVAFEVLTEAGVGVVAVTAVGVAAFEEVVVGVAFVGLGGEGVDEGGGGTTAFEELTATTGVVVATFTGGAGAGTGGGGVGAAGPECMSWQKNASQKRKKVVNDNILQGFICLGQGVS